MTKDLEKRTTGPKKDVYTAIVIPTLAICVVGYLACRLVKNSIRDSIYDMKRAYQDRTHKQTKI